MKTAGLELMICRFETTRQVTMLTFILPGDGHVSHDFFIPKPISEVFEAGNLQANLQILSNCISFCPDLSFRNHLT